MMADFLNFRDLVVDREDRGGDARPSPPATLETPRVEPEDRFDWCPPTPLAFGPPSPVFLKRILPDVPENSGFDDCKDPEKDDGLNFKKPESPGFDDDSDKNLNFEKPGFDKDDNCKDQDKSLNFEKPETLNSEKPESLNSEKPESLNSEKPESLNSEKPETLNSEKPESLNFEKAESSGESFKKPEILDENLKPEKPKLNKSEFEKVFGDVILVCSRPDLKRPVEPENCLTERKKCKRSEKKDECLPKIRCDLPKPGKPGPKKLPGLEKKIKDLSNKPGSDLLKPGKPGSENKDLPRLPRLEKKIKDDLSSKPESDLPKPGPGNKDLPHKKLPVSEKKKDLPHKKLPDLPKPGKPSPEKKNKDKKLPGLEKKIKDLPKPGPEKKNKDKKLPGPEKNLSKPGKPSPEKKNKDKKLPGPEKSLSKPGKPNPEKKNKDKKLPRLEKKIKDLSGSEKKKHLHESSHKKLPGPEKKKLPEKPEKKNKLCKLVFEKKQKFKSVLFLKLFEMSNASERRKIFEKSGVPMIGSGTSLKNFKIPKYKDNFGENDVVCLFPEAEEYKYVYDLNEKQYRDFLEDYRKQLENVKI